MSDKALSSLTRTTSGDTGNLIYTVVGGNSRSAQFRDARRFMALDTGDTPTFAGLRLTTDVTFIRGDSGFEVATTERGFWVNDTGTSGANIWRLADRVFVGEAVNATGNDPTASQGSIFPAFNPPTDGANYVLRDSQLLSISSNGLIAIGGVSRASDKGSSPTETIGVAGVAVNDKATNSVWSLYGDIQHEAVNTTGFSFGLELAVKNKGSNVVWDAYNGGTGTMGIWLAAGGDNSYGGTAANPSGVAIAIGANAHTWNTGILFRSSGLTAIGGESIAIEMPESYSIQWKASANVLGAKIRSDIDTADRDVTQVFENRQVTWYGDNDEEFFRITHSPTAVNYPSMFSAVTGSGPALRAAGNDTNITIEIEGKGTGGSAIKGTGTNDSAAAGDVGEITESTVLVGSAVSLTSGASADVTSISLTAGDWDVWGNVFYTPAATTSMTRELGAISTTTATFPTAPGAGAYFRNIHPAVVPNEIFGYPVGVMRLSLSSTTTVYLVTQTTFTGAGATLGAYGYLGARRVR